MASIITILLFFIYTWGLGFTAMYFLKKPDNVWERHLLNVGVGLGIFPILAIFLNFIHIQLDWRIFLALSLVFPLYVLIQKVRKKQFQKPKFDFKLTKSTISILFVLLIFVASLYTYTEGAFKYTYLEDEDPWGHAVGAKYVALEKNAYDPAVTRPERDIDPVLSYIDPYPPAYDILMGVLHQTSSSLTWTLKFFNALIISLGFIFFYLFAKLFTTDRKKAVFATFVLALTPAFLSHFIWAHSLIVVIFFPTMYALEMTRRDKRWMPVALLLIASIWVTQNLSQPIKLSTMLLIYLVVISVVTHKFFKRGFIALFGGIALSFMWWGAMMKKYTIQGFLNYFAGGTASAVDEAIAGAGSGSVNIFTKGLAILQKVTAAGGSGSRVYTFDDFFYASSSNLINNPIGIGVVITLLAFIGLLYMGLKYKEKLVSKENAWRAVIVFWLIFTFWGVMGKAFPISVAKGTFRVWMLLAIPLAFIATEGAWFLRDFFGKQKVVKTLIIVALVVGIVFTSGIQKYEHNTAIWPTSGSFTPQEATAYGEWFKTIPDNTNVLLYSPRDKLTIGYGKNSCAWCQDVLDFRYDFVNKDVNELHAFMQKHEYKYLIVNQRMDLKYGERYIEGFTPALLQQRYQEMLNSGLFTPVAQAEGVFVVFTPN